MNLLDHLPPHAHGPLGTAEALVTGSGPRRRAISFGELELAVARVAESFRARGLHPGDPVLLCHPVSQALYLSLLGCWHGGFVAVLPHPGGGVHGLRELVRTTRPAAVLLPGWLRAARLTLAELRQIQQVFTPSQLGLGKSVESRQNSAATASPSHTSQQIPAVPLDLDPDHPALWSPTSGSTGRPKIVVRSHGCLSAQLHAVALAAFHLPGERELVTMPALALAAIASGVTAVLADAPLARPAQVRRARLLRQLRQERIDRVIAAPAFFQSLLDQVPPGPTPWPLPQAVTGGGPVQAQLLAELSAALGPGGVLRAVYGSTEAEPIAALEIRNPLESSRLLAGIRDGRGLPLGTILPGLDWAILRTDPAHPVDPARWEELRCEPGEVGELLVAGTRVVPSYLNPDDNLLTKVDHAGQRWHRTGDAVSHDETGALFLFGRISQRLPESTERPLASPWPLAIEAALKARIPGLQCAICAVTDRRLPGTQPLRVLCLPPRTARAALNAVLADAPPWLCQSFQQILELPLPLDRRHQSKIDYPALQKRVLEALDRVHSRPGKSR